MFWPGWHQDWLDSHTRMAFDELDGVDGWIFFRLGEGIECNLTGN